MRCVDGTRDARAIWEDTFRTVLEAADFKSGIASPCIFYHAKRDLTCAVHGDDFTTLGNDENLDWFQQVMEKAFEIKVSGHIDAGCEGPNEIRILKIVLSA